MIECNDKPFVTRELVIQQNGRYSTIGYDQADVDVKSGVASVLVPLEVSKNGIYRPEGSIDGYNEVTVNVPDKPEQTKTVTINQNGTTEIVPDEGSVLSKVDVTVNVAGGGGAVKLTNGTKLSQSAWASVPDYDFSEITDMSKMFQNCSSLNAAPQIDTNKVTDMSRMFSGCSSLVTMSQIDARNATNMENMFYGCGNLKNVSLSNTFNVNNMQSIFMGCTSLTKITYLRCDHCKTLQWAFNGCSKLENANLAYTESVQDWRYTFADCYSLKSMNLQMHGGLNTEGMFQNCTALTTVDLYNTFNVVFMNNMFEYCSSLTSVNTNFNTSKVTDMSSMFNECSALITIPQLDASNVNKVNNMLSGCSSLTNFGGLKNVGKSFNANEFVELSFADSPLLSDESIQNIIDGLYDRTGVTAVTRIKFHTTVKNKLTNEQKQQITAKNWRLQ